MPASYIALLCMPSSKPHPTGVQDAGKLRRVQVDYSRGTRRPGPKTDENPAVSPVQRTGLVPRKSTRVTGGMRSRQPQGSASEVTAEFGLVARDDPLAGRAGRQCPAEQLDRLAAVALVVARPG